MDEKIYREYVAILKEELQPAMGCTEPIAVAYCAALARRTLGALPETLEVLASAHIVKHVKTVIVTKTNGQRGLAAQCQRQKAALLLARELLVAAQLAQVRRTRHGHDWADALFRVHRCRISRQYVDWREYSHDHHDGGCQAAHPPASARDAARELLLARIHL